MRPIQPDEIATFAALGGQPEHSGAVRDWVGRMFASGAMRPAWCYVAEDGGRSVGRVAYWTLPMRGTPLDVVLLDAPWDEPDLTIGKQLLRETLPAMRAAGAGTIGHALDTPPMAPQWQGRPGRRDALLRGVGFAVRRETRRFERHGAAGG